MMTTIAIGAFLLLFLGIPMWMIFLVLAVAGMAWKGVSMEVVVQGLTGSINKLVLLSVPGFIFAGGIMVALIALFPPYIMWAPNAIWKTFDLFVGLIQAFIFSLLTILYFSQSMELDEEHH